MMKYSKIHKIIFGEKAFEKKLFDIFERYKSELVFIMFMVLPNAPVFALRIYCKN